MNYFSLFLKHRVSISSNKFRLSIPFAHSSAFQKIKMRIERLAKLAALTPKLHAPIQGSDLRLNMLHNFKFVMIPIIRQNRWAARDVEDDKTIYILAWSQRFSDKTETYAKAVPSSQNKTNKQIRPLKICMLRSRAKTPRIRLSPRSYKNADERTLSNKALQIGTGKPHVARTDTVTSSSQSTMMGVS